MNQIEARITRGEVYAVRSKFEGDKYSIRLYPFTFDEAEAKATEERNNGRIATVEKVNP
jgi:hypothetical protein